jgi:predicted nucleic acid-binding Zn ribbon protein
MPFPDDVVRLLSRAPGDGARAATESGRGEALATARQAQGTADPATALSLHFGALELDANCKAAYEGIAKLVLANAPTDRAAVEGTLRLVDKAWRRSPSDTGLEALVKKLRAALPGLSAHRETAMARVAAKDPDERPTNRVVGAKPSSTCAFCGSPIPAGSPTCKSCDLSGEVRKPDGVVERRASLAPFFLVLLAILVVGGGGLAYWLSRHH